MLIDFHFHAFSDKIAERAIGVLRDNCGVEPLTDGTLDMALRLFDEWGVDKAVLLPIATKPAQQRIINDWAVSVRSDRVISFGTVHPDAEDLFEEIHRIKSLGLKGYKLHPDYQGFFIDEQRLDSMLSELEAMEMPVVIHAGFDPVSPELVHCTPQAAADMISRHPKLKVVLAHMGGNDLWEDSYEHLCGLGGEVYLDTAYSYDVPDDLMLKMIRRHGSERVLFASDCPWQSSVNMVRKLEKIGLTGKELDNIFWQNALRLLGNALDKP